ncbi:MAG: putative 4-mercaptohistidine N1-methyltransferase [Thiohalocapsa sp.]
MKDERQNPYETDALVNQYLEFHYGRHYFGVDNYPRRCIEACVRGTEGLPRGKALDLGCAVGRSTFELARVFESVVGLDLSGRFIATANQLKDGGEIWYELPVEGSFAERRKADLSEYGLSDVRARTEFCRGDACSLDHGDMDVDLVFAGNLLDRLYEPRRFLRSVKSDIRLGGVLVISSPYTLLEAFTPRENWLSGYNPDGSYISTFEGMRKMLEPDFGLLQAPIDVPFVIRETARKFQHTVAEMSMWQRVR